MLKIVFVLLMALTLGFGQSATIQITYPSGLPWDALRPASTTNPSGYPVRNQFHWPVSGNLGDLDGDGQIDMVYCVEQRVLLAVTFQRNAQGHPTAPTPLWAIFNSGGDVNKSPWGVDHAAVWDVDGDGKDEVCYIAKGSTGGFHLRVIDNNPALCTSACSNQLGTLPVPAIAADVAIDSFQSGWSFRARNGNSNTRITIANIRGLSHAQDIVVYQTQSNEAQVFSFSSTSGLTRLYSIPWRGQETHAPHYFDATGDGKDDCLSNGIWDFHGCPTVYCAYGVVRGKTGFCGGSNFFDHADEIQPIGDINSDGIDDLVLVDDNFSKILLGGARTGCSAGNAVIVTQLQLPYHHARSNTSQNPFPVHGQTVAIGQFIAGTDSCGVSGRQSLHAPKGAPYQNGGSPWGSFVMNSHMQILASTVGTSNGPTGWQPRNIDWDGDRSSDEVFNTIGGTQSVLKLVPSSSTNCGAGSSTDPINGPWTHPYKWSFLANKQTPSGFFDTMQHNFAVDFFGDSRDELVIPGAGGLFIVYNTACNPKAGLHPPSFKVESYRRRFVAPLDRYINYQALPTLQRVEVQPATLGLQALQTRSYKAIGHYSDNSTADVTAFATWTSGDTTVASFSPGGCTGTTSLLTANANGVAAIRATVAGIHSDDAALVMVSNSTAPRILYAGWVDSYIQTNQTKTLKMEVRVADAQNDVLAVGAAVNGIALPALSFVDDGTGGDRVANDGTWTAWLVGVPAGATGDSYFEAIAIDQSFGLSATWPYLAIPSNNLNAPTPGYAFFPFVSEAFGVGPFIAGSGILSGSVTQAGGGTLSIVARVLDPSVSVIGTALAGVDLGSGMNDQGLGADQIAGDGLWTSSLTIPPNSPAGRYVIEHIATDGAARISDAYPRMRTHQ